MDIDRVDFFISYNSKDKAWAEWIGGILENDAGYTTVIQAWDFVAGSNFVLEMQSASSRADRTIIVLSQNYLDAEFPQPEWVAAFVQDPTGKNRRLIPIRVGECSPTGLLHAIKYIDLLGLDAQTASQVLLTQIKTGRLKPLTPPPFPGPSINQLSVSDEGVAPFAESWRQDRVRMIADNSCLTELMKGPSVILHLIPLVACEPELSNEVLEGHGRELQPLYSSGWNHKFGEYGFMTFGQWPQAELPHSYTHFYRTGEVEAVDKALLMPRKQLDGTLVIPAMLLEQDILSATKLYLRTMQNVGIQLPIVVSLSFAQIAGYGLGTEMGTVGELQKTKLLLPSIVIHTWNDDIPAEFKPVFDRLWNVFGYKGSPSYQQGFWSPIS